MSEETANKIDAEVKRLVETAYDSAKRILTEESVAHRRLSEALLEYESLNGDEIAKVLNGEKLDRPDDSGAAPLPPTPALPVTDEDDEPAGAWPAPTPA